MILELCNNFFLKNFAMMMYILDNKIKMSIIEKFAIKIIEIKKNNKIKIEDTKLR